jgi:hypothetical protein
MTSKTSNASLLGSNNNNIDAGNWNHPFSNFSTNFEMGGNADQVAPVGTGALNTGTPDVFCRCSDDRP